MMTPDQQQDIVALFSYFPETKDLSPEQWGDLVNIVWQSVSSLIPKYVKGAIEHGDLLGMTLKEYLLNALDENTDQRVYLLKALGKEEE